MIRTPPIVAQHELDEAIAKLLQKGKAPCADQVKLERIPEGRCVQMLHVGPYDQEARTIAAMEAFAEQQGLTFHGRITRFLSDPRARKPEKLRTILLSRPKMESRRP
jgi:hypothetical protein